MHTTIRHLIIPLLVAALVGLGIAQAGTDFCPPGCGHCSAVKAAPSCCDEMAVYPTAAAVPQNSSKEQPQGCEYGSFCPGGTEQNEMVAGSIMPTPEPEVLFPVVAAFRVFVRPAPYLSIPVLSPPRKKTSAIYTLNCSFLI